MKIAVSVAGNTLDAQVDRRFGRCPYFMIVDSETMMAEAIPNMAAAARRQMLEKSFFGFAAKKT